MCVCVCVCCVRVCACVSGGISMFSLTQIDIACFLHLFLTFQQTRAIIQIYKKRWKHYMYIF